MAQWIGQYSGLTHAAKVKDIEASLRQAVVSFDAAAEPDRKSKASAVHHLAERLLAARLKALRARLDALEVPIESRASGNQLAGLKAREHELQAHGVDGILREFHFRTAPSGEKTC